MSITYKSVTLPSSKSISNRLLLLSALLHGEPLELSNLSKAEDTIYLVNALSNEEKVRYVGEGGTSLRFAMTYFSSLEGTTDIYAAPRLLQRPHDALWEALRAMGADIKEINGENGQGYCITGIDFQSSPIVGRTQQIDVNTSSQFVTALFFLGRRLKKD